MATFSSCEFNILHFLMPLRKKSEASKAISIVNFVKNYFHKICV